MKQQNLLVVDDDPDIGNFIRETVSEIGFDTHIATNTGEFVRAYSADPTVVILDLVMPGADGNAHIKYLSEVNCQAAILLISGFDPGKLDAARQLAEERGLRVVGSLQKPISPTDLRDTLKEISAQAQ